MNEEGKEAFAMVTPGEIFSPQRISQEALNKTPHFQSMVVRGTGERHLQGVARRHRHLVKDTRKALKTSMA